MLPDTVPLILHIARQKRRPGPQIRECPFFPGAAVSGAFTGRKPPDPGLRSHLALIRAVSTSFGENDHPLVLVQSPCGALEGCFGPGRFWAVSYLASCPPSSKSTARR